MERGRLVCSTEACKPGCSETVGPDPLTRLEKLMEDQMCRNFGETAAIAFRTVNTGINEKFRTIFR